MVAVAALLFLSVSPSDGAAQQPEAIGLKNQGDAYLRAGKQVQAQKHYQRAIAKDPKYMDAYGALATLHLRQRKLAEAEKVLRNALNHNSSYPEGWYNLAYALRKQGKPDLAIKCYRNFAKLRPKSADPYYGIGLALKAKADYAAAAQSFKRYAKLEKRDAKRRWVARALKEARQCEELAANSGASAPSKRAEQAMKPPAKTASRAEQGEREDGQGDAGKPASAGKIDRKSATSGREVGREEVLTPDLSAAAAKRRQRHDPLSPQRKAAMKLKTQGDRLLRAGQLKKAAERYREAIATDFTYTSAYDQLGTALFSLKQYDDAIKAFRIAIRDNPDYHAGWYNLAYALRKAGQLDAAVAAYKKHIELVPGEADARYGLALAYKALGREADAIEAFKSYIRTERRQSQERWVHRAKVQLAKLEGREPPQFVPGKVIAAAEQAGRADSERGSAKAAEAAEKKPLSAAERRRKAAQERRRKREAARAKRAAERQARIERRKAERQARIEKRKAAAEKRRQAREARRRELAEKRKALAEKRRQAREERKRRREAAKAKREAERLARIERRKAAAEERRRARRQERQEAAESKTKPARAKAESAGQGPSPTEAALSLVSPAPDVIPSPPMPEEPQSVPDTRAGRLRVQGDTLARSGKNKEALARYANAVKLDPFDTAAYQGLAYAAFKIGAYRKGARRLGIAIRDNPDFTTAWLLQARLYRAAGENVRAVGSYRRYLEASTGDVGVRLELARTLRKLGIQDQAAHEYQQVAQPPQLEGNEPEVVAARQELEAMGITPPALAAAETPSAAAGQEAAEGDHTPKAEKSPAEIRAERRRQAREERKRRQEAAKAKREAERQARIARRKALAEKRRQAREERRRKREAAKAKRKAERQARIARRKALAEKRRQAREERKRKRLLRRLRSQTTAADRAEDRRIARRAAAHRRGRGRSAAPGTDVAGALARDLDDADDGTPPVPPRQRRHHVLSPAPEAAAGLMAVADEQFAKKRYTVALGIYQQAARLDPAGAEPLYKAGVAAVALGRMHLAGDLFARVLKNDPGNETALVNFKMARAAAKTARPDADYLRRARKEAQLALEGGQYASAEQQLSRLIELDTAADLHLLRAEARLALRRPARALRDAGRALALDPGNLDAYRVMGDAHRQLDNRDQARYYYRLYLSRLPRESRAGKRAEIERVLKELAVARQSEPG
jgi:tetratricopeptide (TPR) repeat protein